MPAKLERLRARIIDKTELKKSPAERQAESLLRRLEKDNVIEIDLDSASSRTIRRTFSRAAASLGLDVQLRTRDKKVYVLLREARRANAPSKE